MDDKSAPASAPAPKPTDTEQSPVIPVVQAQKPPKKSKVKLIVGIVIGSLVIVGLTALALWYFLVWQSPQNVLTRAVAKTFTTEKSIASGTITTEMNGAKVEVAIKSASDLPKGKLAATVKISPEGLDKAIEINADGVLADDGTLYFKLDGVKKSVNIVIDQVIQSQLGSGAESHEKVAYMNSPEGKKMMEQVKQQALKQLQPVIDAVDGQWVKISPSDLSNLPSEDTACVFDSLKMIQTDADARKEVAKVYQDNAFLVIKGETEAKDGSKGYDIELDKDKAREFAKAAVDTKLGRKMKDCGGELTADSMTGDSSKGSVDSFRVWIANGELRSVELTQKADGAEAKIAYDLQPGKTETIDVPSDTKTLTELVEELQDAFSDSSSSGLSPFSALSI